jgi:plasmid stabilization system protein ParE
MIHLRQDQIAPAQAAGFRRALREVFARLAEAERTGRAQLDPAQTALVVEVANATFRIGCEIEADLVHAALAEAEIASTPPAPPRAATAPPPLQLVTSN